MRPTVAPPPSSEDSSAKPRAPAGAQPDENTSEGATAEEPPEITQIALLVQVDGVEDEARDHDRGQEPSEANSGLQELAPGKY
eukprot:CAMPEP_0185586788 /NCGR_PEP_ID=MMETSP0434-20130131/46124_1 /TAXON_ID=626734 ORGANISM="Favella taraikaensis, Strain Fe Narragansett Bay" /NCGR_SAMPLE_ID=MMETSP0434 /ASSEMBLY_ACC=CAM_ASM_000379 /LENGTH=82 /DNA_ID=CAMNT_0028208173 /DNA_START=560 /DNA_END=807 /DNA_ORIENTATION=+